jgi:hypothetical protein
MAKKLLKWVDEPKDGRAIEILVDLGHFDTLEKVDKKCEELWGPIERCEEEGSIPWYNVYNCPQFGGFHLAIVSLKWHWDTHSPERGD